MPRAGRLVAVSAVLVITLASPPAGAVMPPSIRLPLVFGRESWVIVPDRGPLPPGHIVIEWSTDESS